MLNKRGFFSDYSLLNEGDYASHESTLAAERAANQRNSINNGINRNLTNLRNDAEDARRAREAIQSQNKLQQLSNYNNFLNKTSDTDHLSVSDLADVRKGIAQQRQEAANKAGIGTIGDFRRSENAAAQAKFKMQHDAQLQSDWDAANSDRNVENLRAFNRFNTDRRLSNLEAENTRRNDADFHNSFTTSNNFDPKLWDQTRKENDDNLEKFQNFSKSQQDMYDVALKRARERDSLQNSDTLEHQRLVNAQTKQTAFDLDYLNRSVTNIDDMSPDQKVVYNRLTPEQQNQFKTELKTKINNAEIGNTLKEVGSAIGGFDGEKAKLAIQNWWQYNPYSGVQLTAGIIGTILVGAGLYTAAKKWREYRARKKAMKAA